MTTDRMRENHLKTKGKGMYGLVIESLEAEHFYSHLCETEKKHGGEYMCPRPKGLSSV